MARIRKPIPGVDAEALIKDAGKLMPAASRRAFLRGAASLGALTMLTGCDIVDEESAEGALRYVSRFNDRVQAFLFNPNKLAPTFTEAQITRPFPFNAYYDLDEAPVVDPATYKFEISGLADNKKPWTLDELHALPEVSQITRHVCVEGWSAIGSWQGAVLSDFLKRIGADTRARYLHFKCAEGYTETIDMPTALHPGRYAAMARANSTRPSHSRLIRITTRIRRAASSTCKRPAESRRCWRVCQPASARLSKHW